MSCFTYNDFCVVFQKFFSILFKFKWGDYIKHQTTMMIGISPELSMALYTICFRARPDEDCYVRLGDRDFRIRTNTRYVNDKRMLLNAHFRLIDN